MNDCSQLLRMRHDRPRSKLSGKPGQAHFFPKAYLRRQGDSDWANHIGNITLVDDYLNKREIRDKKPSDYMRKFKRSNPKLAATMRTHLINVDKFGVWTNDYDRFFDRRCAAIARELTLRVPRRDVDARGQAIAFDDFEEIEVAEQEGAEAVVVSD